MRKVVGWAAAGAVVALVAAYLWFQFGLGDLLRPQRLPEAAAPPIAESPTPTTESQPKVEFPVPSAEVAKPLPPLNDSDAAMREGLSSLFGGGTLAEHAVFSDFVRRVVATIDNLPRKKVSLSILPVKTVPGRFLTATDVNGIRLRPENSARYAAYMRLAESIGTNKLVAFYVRYYPLFQQAYQELGYPKGYFNDRLIVVIDDLLAAPQVPAPLRLVQPKVMFEYADPDLEGRSAGQKIMMRIGNANAATIKQKLRAIRSELTQLARTPPH